MASSLAAVLARAPVPLFGSGELALRYGVKKAAKLPKYALWGAPLVAGGLWFIWPAVGDDTKISLGVMKDPEADAKAKAEKEALEKPIQLPSSATKAIETAFMSHTGPLVDPKILAKIRAGDFTDLEKDWEQFHVDSLAYAEDDDEEGKLQIYQSSLSLTLLTNELLNL